MDVSEMLLGMHFSVLTKLYYGALSKRLEHLELERYYSILILLDQQGGACTQQDISNHLQTDKASMVRIIDFLLKKKYVLRQANPQDKRCYLLDLTTKAKKLMPEIYRGKNELNALALKGLRKKEIEQFYNMLSHIHQNLVHEPAEQLLINYKKLKPRKHEK